MSKLSLSPEEFDELRTKVLQIIQLELSKAIIDETLDDYLSMIGCSDLLYKYQTTYVKTAKILIFGDNRTNIDELKNVARGLGIEPEALEFRLDYKKNKHFDFRILKNNHTYSDVMFGPNAHKSMGIRDNESAIDMFNTHPDQYPKKTEIKTYSGELKITSSSFKNALYSTQKYLDMYS